MIGRRWLGLALAATATPAAANQRMPGEGAFVEHRLALQVSSPVPAMQTVAINNAFNVLTAYGPDKVAIEIVAFAGGIELLRIGNKETDRIASLVKQGVIFDACENTMATLERKTGQPFPRNPLSRPVPSGIVHLITLSEHGYTIIRP